MCESVLCSNVYASWMGTRRVCFGCIVFGVLYASMLHLLCIYVYVCMCVYVHEEKFENGYKINCVKRYGVNRSDRPRVKIADFGESKALSVRCTCVTWCSLICDMTHWYAWCDSFACVTARMPTRDMKDAWSMHLFAHGRPWHPIATV